MPDGAPFSGTAPPALLSSGAFSDGVVDTTHAPYITRLLHHPPQTSATAAADNYQPTSYVKQIYRQADWAMQSAWVTDTHMTATTAADTSASNVKTHVTQQQRGEVPPAVTAHDRSPCTALSSPSSSSSPQPLDVVPPFRFAHVEEGVYRGAYPVLRNFPFLEQLDLRTIISLTPEQPTYDLLSFAEAHGITVKHIQADRFKGEAQLLPTDLNSAIQAMIDTRNLPLYIHCLDGRHVVGLVLMGLRKLQHWDIAASHAEYTRFSGSVEDEVAFIADYSGPIALPLTTIPQWLFSGSWRDAHGRPKRLSTGVKLKFPSHNHTAVTAAATMAVRSPAALSAQDGTGSPPNTEAATTSAHESTVGAGVTAKGKVDQLMQRIAGHLPVAEWVRCGGGDPYYSEEEGLYIDVQGIAPPPHLAALRVEEGDRQSRGSAQTARGAVEGAVHVQHGASANHSFGKGENVAGSPVLGRNTQKNCGLLTSSQHRSAARQQSRVQSPKSGGTVVTAAPSSSPETTQPRAGAAHITEVRESRGQTELQSPAKWLPLEEQSQATVSDVAVASPGDGNARPYSLHTSHDTVLSLLTSDGGYPSMAQLAAAATNVGNSAAGMLMEGASSAGNLRGRGSGSSGGMSGGFTSGSITQAVGPDSAHVAGGGNGGDGSGTVATAKANKRPSRRYSL